MMSTRPSRLRRLAAHLPMPLSHSAVPYVAEARAVQRRRQRVVAATTVGGAVLLGSSLTSRPDSTRFYASTATVAATWLVGGAASGPLHLGWIEHRDSTLNRPVLTPLATGVAAFGVFAAGALIARRIPLLHDAVADILRYADEGHPGLVLATTLANGAAEEVFFRGALYTALIDNRPVAASTATYALATATTRNPALVLAAAVMGALFGLQRRASGGIQAPLLTHLTWSTLMVRFLPQIFRGRAKDGAACRPSSPAVIPPGCRAGTRAPGRW